MSSVPESSLLLLREFFDRPLSQEATKPLRDGIEIAVYIDKEGPATLGKNGGRAVVTDGIPAKPDMTFWVTTPALKQLNETKTEEIGEIGIALCKLMLSSDPNLQLKANVHIGLFDLLRNGYLGVIPLGGASLMKFLASHGFGSIGKIKDAISKLRNHGK
jgi:hypothetical protein